MDRMLYIAMTGARETMRAQAVNSNNLANVSTTGFRADLEAFRSLPVSGPGHASRVYSVSDSDGMDLRPGTTMNTGRTMDIAIDGEGWIAVQAADGGDAFTRSGDLRVDSFGLLRNGAGHPVLGNGGPIAVPPFEKMEIAGDGTITIRPLGQAANTLAVVDRIKLVNPPQGALVKDAEGLIRMRGDQEAEVDAAVRIQSGALETSNVNAVESMINMIENARLFETQVKMMKSAEENDSASAQLMRLG